MTNYNWPFRTLPFGSFWSNLDTRDPKEYPKTYSGNFWNMSPFESSRAMSTFQKMGGLRKSKFSWWRSDDYPIIGLVLGGQVSRLHHGQIWFPIQNTWGCYRLLEVKYQFFDTFLKGSSILIIEVLHEESVHRCILGCCPQPILDFRICHLWAVCWAIKCQLARFQKIHQISLAMGIFNFKPKICRKV